MKKIYIFIIVILCFEIILLSVQNRKMKSKLREYSNTLNIVNSNSRMEYFPNILLCNMQREYEYLFNLYDQREILLLIFSLKGCSDCLEIIEKMHEYYKNNESNYKIVVLSNDSYENTKNFFKDLRLSLPIFVLGEEDLDILNLPAYPAAFLLLPNRRVINSQFKQINESFFEDINLTEGR